MTEDQGSPEQGGEGGATASGAGASHRGPAAGFRARFTRRRIVVASAVLACLVLAVGFGVGPGDGFFRTSDTATTDPGPGPRSDGTTTEPEPDPDDTAAPGETVRSYAGLCRDFQTEALTNGAVAADPDFAPLAEDAGGQSKIKTYCQELLGTPTEDADPNDGSTPGADPTSGSSAAPSAGTQPTPGGGTSLPANPTVTPSPTPTLKPTPTSTPRPTATATPTRPGGGKPTKTPKP